MRFLIYCYPVDPVSFCQESYMNLVNNFVWWQMGYFHIYAGDHENNIRIKKYNYI